MKRLIFVIALSAAALLAQPPNVVERQEIRVIGSPVAAGSVSGAIGGGITVVNAEMGFEAAFVKGVPFTGDFVTENAQTLADGNRIKNSNTTSFARDGEGRTRREITINAIGPFDGGNTHRTIFIHDPVAKIDYVLDPQNKTARKVNVGGMAGPATANDGKEIQTMVLRRTGPPQQGAVASTEPQAVFNRRIEGPNGPQHDVVINHEGLAPAGPEPVVHALPPGIVMNSGAGAVFSQRIQISDAASTSTNTSFKNDSLGKRIIEGVEAEGTRTILTIPAGQIGNERALETISERWYSNELKTVVLTTRTDPRTGDSTYRLTNLRRGEPGRHLFELPPDYKVITEDNVGPGMFRTRVDRKQEE